MNLMDATMLALQGKLIENKRMVDRLDYEIHNNHEANWFGNHAGWDDIRELNLKNLTDTDRIKVLQNLKNSIDNDVKQRDDYNDIPDNYRTVWLDGYKGAIDYFLRELTTKGKFYIGLDVDVSKQGDVDHRFAILDVVNGTISRDEKFYDTKGEAENALNSISKSELEKFVLDNMIGEYDEDFTWKAYIDTYVPTIWEIQ